MLSFEGWGFIPKTFVSNEAIFGFCIFIICFFIFQTFVYFKQRTKVKKLFYRANKILNKEIINEEFNYKKWGEVTNQLLSFNNSIFKVEIKRFLHQRNLKTVYIKNDGIEEINEIFVLDPPSTFFNEESMILRQYNMDWYNAVPGILTGMGLLFTFIGLASGIYLGLNGLDIQEQNFNINQMTDTLKSLLSGASLAFITSIVGLFSALIFQSVVKVMQHGVLKSIAIFNDTLEICTPLKSGVELQYETREAIKNNSTKLSDFNSDLQQLLQEQFNTVGDNILTGFDKIVASQSEILADIMTKAMDVFSENLNKYTQKLNDSLQNSAQQIKDASIQLENMLSIMKESTEETGKALIEQVVTTKGYMQEITSDFRVLGKDLNKEIGDISNIIRSLGSELNNETDTIINNVSSIGINLNKEVNSIVDSVHLLGENLNKEMSGVKNSFDLLGEGFEEKIKVTSNYINNLVDDISKNILDSGINFESRLTKSVSTACSGIIDIQNILNTQKEQLKQFTSIVEQLNLNNFEQIASMMGKVLQQQQTTLNLTELHYETMQEQSEQFEKYTEQQRESMQESVIRNLAILEKGLEQIQTSLSKDIAQVDSVFGNALNVLSKTLKEYGQQQNQINKDWQAEISHNMKLLKEANQSLSKGNR